VHCADAIDAERQKDSFAISVNRIGVVALCVKCGVAFDSSCQGGEAPVLVCNLIGNTAFSVTTDLGDGTIMRRGGAETGWKIGADSVSPHDSSYVSTSGRPSTIYVFE
jgi:hypothetical protein